MYYAVIKPFGHLRSLENSLVFSNARPVLSQCNTRLRLLYLLIIEKGENILVKEKELYHTALQFD